MEITQQSDRIDVALLLGIRPLIGATAPTSKRGTHDEQRARKHNELLERLGRPLTTPPGMPARKSNAWLFWLIGLLALGFYGASQGSSNSPSTAGINTSVSSIDYNNTTTLSTQLLSDANAAAATKGLGDTVSTVNCLPSGAGAYDCRFVWASGSVIIHTFLVAADGSSYLAKAT